MKKYLTLALVSVLFLISAKQAFAANNVNVTGSLNDSTANKQGVTVNGISITPLLTTLTASKGQDIPEKIQMYNYYTYPVNITMQFAQFTSQDQYGTAQFTNFTNQKFNNGSISINIPGTTTLVSGQYTNINFSINVAEDAEPGEYFIGVFGSIVAPPSGQSSGAVLNSSVGSMYLITVSGSAREAGYIRSFSPTSLFNTTMPVTFNADFVNTGNVHLIPQGQIMIYDMFGRKVETLTVNLDRHLVLPVGVNDRIFTNVWKSGSFLLGRYSATLYLTYGSKTVTTTYYKTSFWIIPNYLIVGVLVIVVVLIIWAVGIRRLKRRKV